MKPGVQKPHCTAVSSMKPAGHRTVPRWGQEALQGTDILAVRPDCQIDTAIEALPIDEHITRAALPHLAAFFHGGHPVVVAEHIRQGARTSTMASTGLPLRVNFTSLYWICCITLHLPQVEWLPAGPLGQLLCQVQPEFPAGPPAIPGIYVGKGRLAEAFDGGVLYGLAPGECLRMGRRMGTGPATP